MAGVRFKLTYADGTNVDQDGGKVSTNGIYVTDSNGQINVQGVTGTIIATEIETIPGYIIDPNTKSQTVKVNADDTQYITFYNTPTQTLVIQKLVEGSKDQGQFRDNESARLLVPEGHGLRFANLDLDALGGAVQQEEATVPAAPLAAEITWTLRMTP